MKKSLLTAALVLTAGPALAHTGHGDASGLVHGALHPLAGADHLLAMLAVGMWSGLVMPRRVWVGALTFMVAMVAGAALSWAGIDIAMVETWIALSVLAFGAMVILSREGQRSAFTTASLVVIAGFAACHGHAHATEATGSASAYLAGFLGATAALHLGGIVLARGLAQSRIVQTAAGAVLAGSGLWLALG